MRNDILAILPSYAAKSLQQFADIERIFESRIEESQKREYEESISDIFEIEKLYIKNAMALRYNQRKPMEIEDGVAKIHVKGFLGNLTFLEKCGEASDYSDIKTDIEDAESNEEVSAIFFDIDSPGGSALGCFELAEIVAGCNKPTMAYTSSICGSAAYFIASACQLIYASPSAIVGSIGTISSWVDYEGMLKSAGITPHIVTSQGADMKAAGNSLRSPSESELDSIRTTVNAYGEQFVGFVKSMRQVSPDILRGNTAAGRKAEALGLIDGVTTEEQAFIELLELAGEL